MLSSNTCWRGWGWFFFVSLQGPPPTPPRSRGGGRLRGSDEHSRPVFGVTDEASEGLGVALLACMHVPCSRPSPSHDPCVPMRRLPSGPCGGSCRDCGPASRGSIRSGPSWRISLADVRGCWSNSTAANTRRARAIFVATRCWLAKGGRSCATGTTMFCATRTLLPRLSSKLPRRDFRQGRSLSR